MINKNFLEDLINEIVDMMADDLSADQIKKLRNVLHIKLKEYSIEKLISKMPWNSDCNISKLNKFIATKRLEGLSENSLEQYSRAIKNLFKEIQKPLDMINTDDIRYYLSKYNEERKVSNVTLNNMRRYCSTFLIFNPTTSLTLQPVEYKNSINALFLRFPEACLIFSISISENGSLIALNCFIVFILRIGFFSIISSSAHH